MLVLFVLCVVVLVVMVGVLASFGLGVLFVLIDLLAKVRWCFVCVGLFVLFDLLGYCVVWFACFVCFVWFVLSCFT